MSNLPNPCREYTILADDREKKPLLFPNYLPFLHPNGSITTIRLHATKCRLPTADYALFPDAISESTEAPYLLAAHSTACVVECKRSLDELANNLLLKTKRDHFEAQLERMARTYARSVLLLQIPITDLTNPSPRTQSPFHVMDILQRLCFRHSISLHLLGNTSEAASRATGEWVARFLINATITVHELPKSEVLSGQ